MGLATVAEPIDESHFHVMIRACPSCGQRFVSVFTETIDWADGDDPQYWTMAPLTDAEADDLIKRGESLDEETLNALPARRCLSRDSPKGSPTRTFWDSSLYVRYHD